MKYGKLKICVIEDDSSVRNLMTTTLKSHQYPVTFAKNATEAMLDITSNNPDLILMDLGLPDMDGIELIESIRTFSSVPIIVISARSDDSDKIEALDSGADDYLTKPFSVDELLARIRSISRRLLAKEDGTSHLFKNGCLMIDYSSGEVTVDGEVIHLMPIEYNLLGYMAQNVGKVCTYSSILQKVWGSSLESDLSSLRVYMASLRKKIEKNEVLIQTHIGVGYRMIKLD